MMLASFMVRSTRTTHYKARSRDLYITHGPRSDTDGCIIETRLLVQLLRGGIYRQLPMEAWQGLEKVIPSRTDRN